MSSSSLKNFWYGGGRFLLISIPSLALLHYGWFKLQFMEEIIPEKERKDVIRAGAILIDKNQNISLIKPGEMLISHESDDRKAGK